MAEFDALQDPDPTLTRRCSTVVFGQRVQHWQCCRKGVVVHCGKWYCRQHDPAAVQAKRDAADAKWRAQSEAEDRVDQNAEALGKALGCQDEVTVWRGRLVMSFEDAERLVARLEKR